MQQLAQWTQLSPSEDDVLVTRELEVAERIRGGSEIFSIRQMASIHKMSMPFLRQFAERHGITFAEAGGTRTKRLSGALIHRERRHTSAIVARSVTRKSVSSLDSEKITPELRERARRRDQESVNGFVEYLRALSMTHTREQAAKQAGISPTFMRTMAYDQELVFVGETTSVAQPVTPAVIKKLQGTLFRPSRKVSSTTSRLLREYVMNDAVDDF
ncbi:hypothetical protein F2S72_01660 [Pseudomonas syringae pv. actinidiae]|nr:hypothetical protein [Pseudomonas syringae pv. actinidiae]